MKISKISKRKQNALTARQLRRLFDYDPKTGVMTYRARRNSSYSRIRIGEPAGWLDRRGYLRLGIGGFQYLVHRLAWLYMTGHWPNADIDHKNGKLSDNRWRNLRECTISQNQWNTAINRKNNTTGFKGVCRHHGKFTTSIQCRGVRKHLGSFTTAAAAHRAYCAAAHKLFGEFARYR